VTLVALGNGAADIFAAIASERFQKAKMIISYFCSKYQRLFMDLF